MTSSSSSLVIYFQMDTSFSSYSIILILIIKFFYACTFQSYTLYVYMNHILSFSDGLRETHSDEHVSLEHRCLFYNKSLTHFLKYMNGIFNLLFKLILSVIYNHFSLSLYLSLTSLMDTYSYSTLRFYILDKVKQTAWLLPHESITTIWS